MNNTNFLFDANFNLNRIKLFLDNTKTEELILLRGHLLIEEIIDFILIQKISDKSYKRLNLNFSRKVDLFCGLYIKDYDNQLIVDILAINKMRNMYAHNLDSSVKELFINYLTRGDTQLLPKTINRKSTLINTMRKFLYYT